MGTEDAGRLLLATLAWVALSSHGLRRDTRTPHQRCPSSPNTSVKRTDALSPRDVLSSRTSRPPRQRTSLSSSPSPSPSTREIGEFKLQLNKSITALLPLSPLRVKLKPSIYILHLGTACRTDLGTACRTDLGTAFGQISGQMGADYLLRAILFFCYIFCVSSIYSSSMSSLSLSLSRYSRFTPMS